ncbi:MAG: hypothetical protein GOV15_00800, partial [Candidatus Diapherotrites archaeon]|nr:hypothetical protein [Candidatus Diapherotrites archaeon]
KGVGFRGKTTKKIHEKKVKLTIDGLRRRKTVRGNTVSDETMQVNLKVTQNADKVAGFFEVKEEPKAESEEEKKE